MARHLREAKEAAVDDRAVDVEERAQVVADPGAVKSHLPCTNAKPLPDPARVCVSARRFNAALFSLVSLVQSIASRALHAQAMLTNKGNVLKQSISKARGVGNIACHEHQVATQSVWTVALAAMKAHTQRR